MGVIRDLGTRLEVVPLLLPELRSSDTTTPGIDLFGADSALIVLNVGSQNGNLSASNRIDVYIQCSDSLGSGYADVGAGDLSGVSGAQLVSVRARPLNADTIITASYLGTRRFLRAFLGFVGTHNPATGVSLSVVKGYLRRR